MTTDNIKFNRHPSWHWPAWGVLCCVVSLLTGCGNLPDSDQEASKKQKDKTMSGPVQTTPPETESDEDPGVTAIPIKPDEEDADPADQSPQGANEASSVKQQTPVENYVAKPNHFLVTLVDKDTRHPQFGIGSDVGFSVNDVPGKEIVLNRGETYFFDVRTNVKHDFYLATNSVGWGSGVFTDGVKGNFTYKGQVKIQTDSKTPKVLYYQCRNHKSMGWKIHVVNKGEKVALGQVERVSPGSIKKPSLSENAVKQKIQYAKLLSGNSSAAKRIKSSGDKNAKARLKQVEALIKDAEKKLGQNNLQSAMNDANQALRLMTQASKASPQRVTRASEELRTEYKHLVEGTRTYQKSYRSAVTRAKKQGKPVTQVDLGAIEEALKKAQSKAEVNKYEDAVEMLKKAQEPLILALNKMLKDQTVVYDLKFANAKEEYEYEVSRYNSYQELVPLAIQRKRPNPGTISLMKQYEKKANKIMSEAGTYAKKGDYKTAILGVQAATKEIRRALRLVGV